MFHIVYKQFTTYVWGEGYSVGIGLIQNFEQKIWRLTLMQDVVPVNGNKSKNLKI